MCYYKCNGIGHVNKDFPLGSSPICFRYKQVGHKKVDFPGLTGGAVQTQEPATMMINDGRDGRVEAPIVRFRAFQFDVEEIEVTSYVLASMYRILFLHAFIIYAYDYAIVCAPRYVRFS